MKRQGFLWIHSAPAALCPHIEWAIGGLLGLPQKLDWRTQPALRNTFAVELAWTGTEETAAELASKFRSWPKIRFEVVQHPEDGLGVRYSYTPSLGLFQTPIGEDGNALIHEERLRAALNAEVSGESRLRGALAELLGTAWDQELDVFRYAPENGGEVRWLTAV